MGFRCTLGLIEVKSTHVFFEVRVWCMFYRVFRGLNCCVCVFLLWGPGHLDPKIFRIEMISIKIMGGFWVQYFWTLLNLVSIECMLFGMIVYEPSLHLWIVLCYRVLHMLLERSRMWTKIQDSGPPIKKKSEKYSAKKGKNPIQGRFQNDHNVLKIF